MTEKEICFRGCLLGLAIGDALGAFVDKKSWEEIRQAYGPLGILGYDLTHGCAEASSYTQLAAFSCNALLKSIARGCVPGSVNYRAFLAAALQEWQILSHPAAKLPGRTVCWVSHVPQLRKNKCLDPYIQSKLTGQVLGTVSAPLNSYATPGSLTAAVPVGLFFHPERMEFHEIGQVGAQAVALTHGDPGTFLSGALLAYIIAGVVNDRQTPLAEHFSQAAKAVRAQFGKKYPQAAQLKAMVDKVISLASQGTDPAKELRKMSCDTGPKALAGALYTCLACNEDFDRAMILAVNHSGRSAAVGAVTGAILGARCGEGALPDFYLDNLEAAPVLRELAKDLCQAGPRQFAARLFDDDWDRKYIQGQPVP